MAPHCLTETGGMDHKEEEFMSQAAKITLLVGGLFVLWVLTWFLRREPIERDLAHRIALALNRPEFSQVSVTMAGRDATLTGIVATPALIQEAKRLAANVWGVRIVQDRLEVVATRPRVFATIQGSIQDGTFVLKGLLPNADLGEKVSQVAAQVYGAGKVNSLFAIDPAAEFPDFFEPAYLAFFKLKGIEMPGFSITQDKFILTGKVGSAELKDKIATELRAALGSLPLQNDLEVVQRVTDRPSLDDLLTFLARNPIRFDFASSRLTQDSREILDQLLDHLNKLPDSRFEIEGHSDDIGSDEYNLRLSRARAISVRLYLLERGIAPERLSVKGYGEARPVASNETESGRQQNRRVEFKLK